MGVKKESTNVKENISEDAYKELLVDELEKKSLDGTFVWTIFFLCITPNILNGFHVSSYTLLGHLPDDQWCDVTALQQSNWTTAQQRHITEDKLTSKGCTIWDWDYKALSVLSYEKALEFVLEQNKLKNPTEISCKSKGNYVYADPESSFVSEWELVCDRLIQRTSAQAAISLGKFFGSFSFGIFADRYGRKSSFTLGVLFFIVSSFICTFSPWYNLFLVGRFGLGAASSGIFYPAYSMVVENVCLNYRSWMSIIFPASYPVGMIVLAIIAFFVHPWRYVQLALTLPALLLIPNCFFMKESPRWLITNKLYKKAYKNLFNKKSPYVLIESTPKKKLDENAEEKSSCWDVVKEGPLREICELFNSWKMFRMILTSYFMFCVTSLSYYVTALNAANISVSRYLYVAITGLVDLPSYLVPLIMLRYIGRRATTMWLFFLTGLALLIILLVPVENSMLVFGFAMLGRFGISATYAVVTLYTAELYPTEIRNSALGTCSTWAHVGSVSAPYVVDVLGNLGWYIPTTICGCCVIVAGLLTITLPETGSNKLTDHITDVPSELGTEEAHISNKTKNLDAKE